MDVRISIYLTRLPSTSSSLFTTYVASWLDTVLLEYSGFLMVRLLINRGTLLPS